MQTASKKSWKSEIGECLLCCISNIKLQVDFRSNESNSNFFCNLDEMSWCGKIVIKIAANWINPDSGRDQLTAHIWEKTL